MRYRSILLSLSFVASGLTAFPAETPASPPPAAPAVKVAANPETSLKKDMPADDVRRLMGAPAEIKPMKSPDGKAEIWVYKRQAHERFDRIELGSIPITETVAGADGKAHQQVIGQKQQFGDVRWITEETIEVLMFDDHYVTQKISRRETKSFL
jgi:hypothetical protein